MRTSKLSPEQLQSIIHKYQHGIGTRLLAKEFGIGRNAIKGHLKRADVYKAHEHASKRKPQIDHKTCTECKIEKGIDCFDKDRSEGDGHQKRCRPCLGLRNYFNRILRAYGVTREAWQAAWDAQKGCCPICGTPLPRPPSYYLSVDHNHETGAFRGLLCPTCNTGLGHFHDNVTFCLRAASYLVRRNK